MVSLFGTLGWRPESLVPSIRSTPNLESLTFYHSDHPDSHRARDSIVEYCETIGLPWESVELPDAFDILQITKRMKDDVRRVRQRGHEIARFNISGGTRLMSSAALLVCILEGIPAVYVHDETYEEIHLPLLRIEYSTALTPKQRSILKFLMENKGREYTESELAEALRVHKATMNHHLKILESKGVIGLVTSPKDPRAKLVRPAPALELLLG
ncbi:MAG: helix-turn-helix domain-containing protein [Thermoplasmata archaeon]